MTVLSAIHMPCTRIFSRAFGSLHDGLCKGRGQWATTPAALLLTAIFATASFVALPALAQTQFAQATDQAQSQTLPATQATPPNPLIIIELFTSEGCDLCPPADELMTQLNTWADVLPLSLHVDYWDYIGWQDQYALPIHTIRQSGYAARTTRGRLFTPLIVVGGVDMIEGYGPMHVVEAIAKHRTIASGVVIEASETPKGTILVEASAIGRIEGGARVLMVTFHPHTSTHIETGSNAGHVIENVNVVTGWIDMGPWDGTTDLRLEGPPPDEPAAVFVQAGEQGLILAATRLP